LAILEATLEATAEGMMIVDTDRNIVAWNQNFTQMLQIPDEIMATRNHQLVISHAAQNFADPASVTDGIEAIHSTPEVVHDEIILRDGRVIDRYTAPVVVEGEGIVGRVTFLRDVTDERRATEALERARAQAEAASEAKSMFLANMSHELRTPLNAVIGLADLLLLEGGEPLTEKQTKYLEGIVQSGRHLLAMVNDVLDLAKIEAGKQELDIVDVATADAIVEAVGLLQPLAKARDVSLEAAVEPGVPQIKADPIRFRQILYNLISNAVKFTDRTGSVRVSANADSRGVMIRVADTGIGIAPENMSRLFRAFEQLALPSGDRPGGTGLGLALTKRLVDMHGGTIDVTSRVGRGTTFTVRLPVA
jgi:PAS domain S-box-containing protein